MMGTKERHAGSTHQRFSRTGACHTIISIVILNAHLISPLCASSYKRPMQALAVPPLNELVFFKLQLVMFFEDIVLGTSPDAACG
jgi:hypothetical protein